MGTQQGKGAASGDDGVTRADIVSARRMAAASAEASIAKRATSERPSSTQSGDPFGGPARPMHERKRTKLAKCETPDALDEVMARLGIQLAHDLRGGGDVVVEGDKLRSTRPHELESIISRAKSELGIAVPYPGAGSSEGKVLWGAWRDSHGLDPVAKWLEACADKYTFDVSFMPERMLPNLFGERVTRHDDDYLGLVGWTWYATMLALVARALNPPVRFDLVPILLSAGGVGKTTLVTNLLPEQWTLGGATLAGMTGGPDAKRKLVEQTGAKAIVELGEFDARDVQSIERLKAFTSLETVRARQSYRRDAADTHVRAVYLATTNDHQPIPPDDAAARRFVVIHLAGPKSHRGGKPVHDFLLRCRASYWASAVWLYRELVEDGEGINTVLALPEEYEQAHAAMCDKYIADPEPDYSTKWRKH